MKIKIMVFVLFVIELYINVNIAKKQKIQNQKDAVQRHILMKFYLIKIIYIDIS